MFNFSFFGGLGAIREGDEDEDGDDEELAIPAEFLHPQEPRLVPP